MSDSEVTIFLAVAAATENNALGYGAGETHAVLIFMREKIGASPDAQKAAAELAKRGWSDVKISEAASVSVAPRYSLHPKATGAYREALNDGFAALTFSEPITRNYVSN